MNSGQMGILRGGIVLGFLALLFPPWLNMENGNYVEATFSFFLARPMPNAAIYGGLLCVELGLISLGTLALILTVVPNKKRSV